MLRHKRSVVELRAVMDLLREIDRPFGALRLHVDAKREMIAEGKMVRDAERLNAFASLTGVTKNYGRHRPLLRARRRPIRCHLEPPDRRVG